MKRVISLFLILAICLSLCACGKSDAAQQYDTAVSLIGIISLSSEAALTAAEEAYEALTDEERSSVAESYAIYLAKREEYDMLVAEIERNQRIADAKAMIDAIGEVTLGSGDAISAAANFYARLSNEEQAQITNYASLQNAQAQYQTLLEAERERVLFLYGDQFEIMLDADSGVTCYRHKNMPQYINTRSYIAPLVFTMENLAWFTIRYNYTGDSWIYWEKLTIIADGQTYEIAVEADKIRRDSGSDVWEYYDDSLVFELPMDSEEILMLRAIADSDITVVRFQGSEYRYDLLVSPEDKQAINDALAIYSVLRD